MFFSHFVYLTPAGDHQVGHVGERKSGDTRQSQWCVCGDARSTADSLDRTHTSSISPRSSCTHLPECLQSHRISLSLSFSLSLILSLSHSITPSLASGFYTSLILYDNPHHHPPPPQNKKDKDSQKTKKTTKTCLYISITHVHFLSTSARPLFLSALKMVFGDKQLHSAARL